MKRSSLPRTTALARTTAVVAALTSTFAGAPFAWATPTFPEAIRERLSLGTEPPCALCHVGGERRGTVTTPFGAALRDRGLVAYDVATLSLALEALEAARRDSDKDGTPDVDELRAGTNPNFGVTPAAEDDLPTPDYGCHVPAIGAPAGEGPVTCALVALGLVVLGRRSRRREVNAIGT